MGVSDVVVIIIGVVILGAFIAVNIFQARVEKMERMEKKAKEEQKANKATGEKRA